jgi:DNA-binding CsgD family transcriptional regulator
LFTAERLKKFLEVNKMKETGMEIRGYWPGEYDSSDIITRDNVKRMGEKMAVCALKGFMKNGLNLSTLYKSMLRDICRSQNPMSGNIQDVFSAGYDFCQGAICFLCGHYGKTLNDILGTDKRGKTVTVKCGCLRAVSKSINAYLSHNRRAVCINETIDSELTAEFDRKPEEYDYTAADKIIGTLGLTDRQRDALICRMNGMSYPEAGRALSINQSSVFEIIAKIRKIYLTMFAAPKLRNRKTKQINFRIN